MLFRSRETILEMVDEMLDCDGQVLKVAGMTYTPSQVLREMDPIAYNEQVQGYIDCHLTDLRDEVECLDPELDADEIADLNARIEELEDFSY